MTHSFEVKEGNRFEFGKNWSKFIKTLTPEKVEIATKSMKDILGVNSLKGKTFLDGGSGSGLFSLAARNLGAKVVSFDFDPNSVATTEAVKEKFFPNCPDWKIIEGSILDEDFLISLGKFDVVYSWGVIHHTGEMWKGLNLIHQRVKEKGLLTVAIYNDQGWASKAWTFTKKLYCKSPSIIKPFILGISMVRLWGPRTIIDILKGKPFQTWKSYKSQRGMSPWRDIVDWVGGYPFEVAKPEEIFNFYKGKGMQLKKLYTCRGGKGCNEFVFENIK